jgi:hypothetical protein
LNLAYDAGLDNPFEPVDTTFVAHDSWQMATGRPSPIAIHHDGDMGGERVMWVHVSEVNKAVL